MKHTPGPWEIRGTYHTHEMIALPTSTIITDANGVVHAYVSQGNWPGDRDANARLIAAAPELLAALREVFEFHRDEYGDGPLTRLMSTAIAKAEGTTND
jgi:hypothetical protein